MLEPAQLAAGISNCTHGRFDLYRVNPPLVRMVAALPVLATGCKTDWTRADSESGSRPEFAVGSDFVATNGNRSLWLFTLARWACIPFTLAGGYFCYCWSRDLWQSDGAGLFALALWTFEPNILAHGELISTDAAATSMGLGAALYFWRWLRASTRSRAIVAGVVLGIAQLVKLTWLLLFILWPVIWLVWRCQTPPSPQPRAPIRQLALILVLGLCVLNLGYGCNGTLKPLGEYTFFSAPFTGATNSDVAGNRFRNTWMATIPIPVPEQYLHGLDLQLRDFCDYPYASYLAGNWRTRGWWYYYAFGGLVKVPHGTQLLAVITAWLMLHRYLSVRESRTAAARTRSRDLTTLLLPPLGLFAVLCSQTAFTLHFRYALPCLAFLFVAAGAIFRPRLPMRRSLTAICTAALTATVVSSLSCFPHSLAYFNEFSGGSANGYRQLTGSNFDWGQDVLMASRSSPAHKFTAVIGNFPCHPLDLGVGFAPGLNERPAREFPPGHYLVSRSAFAGAPLAVYGPSRMYITYQPDDLARVWRHCQFRPLTETMVEATLNKRVVF